MSEPSKLSQQVVALVLAHVGVRSNPEARHDAAVNVDAHLRELRQRLAQVEKERDSFPSRAAALCREKAVVHDMRCGTQFPNPLECDCAAKQFIILADELEQLQP